MTAWVNADVLIEMLERQLKSVLSYQNEKRIFVLSRWLEFLNKEPQLSGLKEELIEETYQVISDLTQEDHKLREQLRRFWLDNASEMLEYFDQRDYSDTIQAHGSLTNFGERVSKRPVIDDKGSDRTERLASMLGHYSTSAIQQSEMANIEPLDVMLEARKAAEFAKAQVLYIHRQLETALESLAGAALLRLQMTVANSNPIPPSSDGPDSGLELAVFKKVERSFSDSLHKLNSWNGRNYKSKEVDVVTSVATQVSSDIRLVTHELGLRLLAGRSRVTLIRRYAARCEAFEAERLREIVKNRPGTAEHELTLSFAKFLFDEGLKPLLDPTISGLRPDVIVSLPGSLLYVEAKQYGDDGPRRKILDAYKQVWGTWGSLRHQYPETVSEAFLLVFRVSGPRVELPEVLPYRNLRLYSILVDISEKRGSEEKRAPISFDDCDLLPQAVSTTGPSGEPNAP